MTRVARPGPGQARPGCAAANAAKVHADKPGIVLACGGHVGRPAPISLRFDRGTLEVGGNVEDIGAIWDARSTSWRMPAYRFATIAAWAAARGGVPIRGDLRTGWTLRPRPTGELELRAYQQAALDAWTTAGQRGVVALATGAGKTRVALGAMLQTGFPTAVLCPTRVLAAAWLSELRRWFSGETIGLVGDGERRIGRVTVFTFESAFRHMDAVGDRFGLLVVDEAHHFGSGARIEALEASAAIARLGLTATAPSVETEQAVRLDGLLGPVVFEMGYRQLVGTHLAPVSFVRYVVQLEPDERREYGRLTGAYSEMVRTFLRSNPGADIASLVRALGRTPAGLRAMRDHGRALDLAGFPRAKRARVRELLERHKAERKIVFTAYAEHAYAIAADNFVPVIAAETSTRERDEILMRFREGPYRTIVSARVLNEGIDVPEARIALIVAGVLGVREHVQRIGRVLRPAPGKEALVYELVTAGTSDARRAERRARDAAHTPH